MQITHPQTLVTALFLGAYALGFRYGVPAAMLPWQVRTWVCLIALLFGCKEFRDASGRRPFAWTA
jgi:hypothetical protein